MRLLTPEEKHLYREVTGREVPKCKIRRKPGWFLPSKMGFTFARMILLRKGDETLDLVVHEMVHVQQWADGGLAFWARYLWFWLLGRNNPYEIEAYTTQRKAQDILMETSDG